MERLEDVYLVEGEKADYRRRATTLRECGTAVFLFGVWSTVRTTLYTVLFRDKLLGDVGPIPNGLLSLIVFAIALVLTLPDLVVRFLCWRGSARLAKGKKCSPIIMVLLAFLCLIEVVGIVLDIYTIVSQEASLTTFVSLLIDCISAFLSFATYLAALYMRRYIKGVQKA